LIELYANNNPKIKDVSFMTNLKKLYADKDCGIDQKGIQGLDLIELYCTINEKIKDVSFMRNLKILYVDNCGIDQQGIRGLDLIELHCRRNEKIQRYFIYEESYIMVYIIFLCILISKNYM